jgi:hypothetical protein
MTIMITTASAMRAELKARQAIKEKLRRQGIKTSHLPARDISAAARDYLLEHKAELLPAARAQITNRA